jgi:hypothetical protein
MLDKRLHKTSQMLIDAKLAIKRLNTRKAKLDKMLSFGKPPHDKTRLGYNEFNKIVVANQNLNFAEKKRN